MNVAEYRAHRAVNHSSLKQMERSPLWFRWCQVNPKTPTDAMDVGSICDLLQFTPDDLDRLYTVFTGDRRTKAGKDDWAALQASGKRVVKQDIWDRGHDCDKAIREHMGHLFLNGSEAVRDFVQDYTGSRKQEPLFWTDDETGVECKGLVDSAGRFLTDLKTTNATIFANGDRLDALWGRHVLKMNYHVQLAFYRDGLRANGHPIDACYNIVCESTPPHDVFVAEVFEHDLELGQQTYRRWLHEYRECTESGVWPGVADGITFATLPEYAYHSEEFDLDWSAA